MGWVDLWREILFCNVLDKKPSIWGVPLPVPLNELSYNDGMGLEFGSPLQRRGIAFIREENCLKFVHLESVDRRLPGYDKETGNPLFQTDKWVLTTFRNRKMTGSFDDWHEEFKVESSDIKISPAIS
ncbi:hypothetical protein PR202_ga29129 [Eleusine coracana subsp. coracana]|uniref:DUF1618 domain-containing protein n=1 Tax=Eleusine coracana subsp. coracana TaxID=191504 RepID=A0AAV5DL78_ELECO|nr:hypothetical protein PR202_ga29129 [Eleusine coracana subsp. coracana]